MAEDSIHELKHRLDKWYAKGGRKQDYELGLTLLNWKRFVESGGYKVADKVGFGAWSGRISVEFVKHENQRYDTCGDWYLIEEHNGQRLHIRISDTDDDRANFALFKHELDEALLYLFKRNFSLDSVKSVDTYDMNFVENKLGDEPGDMSIAPYYAEHMYASSIERDTAMQIGLDWDKYTQLVSNLGEPE